MHHCSELRKKPDTRLISSVHKSRQAKLNSPRQQVPHPAAVKEQHGRSRSNQLFEPNKVHQAKDHCAEE
jgi:hypothetical protein